MKTPYHKFDKRPISILNYTKIPSYITLLGIDKIHQYTRGEGIKYAILDTEVDKEHVEVQYAIEKYVNVTNEPRGKRGVVHHGTAVTSIISGHKKMFGIAPKATGISYKVLKNNGFGSASDTATSLKLARFSDKCDIANLSLGSDNIDAKLESAIKEVVEDGMIVICAAGNDGTDIDSPASDPNTIAVAALGLDGLKWFVAPFSSPTTKEGNVNVAAPGVKIKAAVSGGGYRDFTGTSASSPFLTGCIILWLSAKKAGNLDQVKKIISETSLKILPEKFVGEGIIQPNAPWGAISKICEHDKTIHPKLNWLNKLFWKLTK